MKQKGRGFMSGVALLTLSAACAKICGMLFKLPLFSIIGDGGMGYFNSAYVIYTFFFVLSTSGLPVGLSILIAESTDERSRLGYLKSGLWIFGGLGLFFCLLMLFIPVHLATLIGNPNAAEAIRVMAPSLLAVCLSGCLRGYFQGLKNMMPTAISQVIESVFKTALGILFAYFSIKNGGSEAHAAAMALAGVSIGSILAFFYLVGAFYLSMRGKVKPIFYGCKYRPWGKKGYAGRLLAVVLPVSAASVVLSVSSVIDLSVIMKGLVHSGCSLELANELYGNYSGSAVPLFNLPSVLVAPVASAVIPYLAKDTKGKKGDALALAGSSIRLAIIISAPCVFGLSLLAKPILTLLFGEESASVASPMLVLLAPAVLFVAVQTVSGAILQGGGMRKTPVVSLACGAAVKLLFCIVLVPRIGLAGAPIGTLACYFVSAFINTYFCVHRKMASFNPLSDFGIPILCAALCGFVSMVMVRVLPDGGIFTLCSIGIGAVIYFVGLVLCGAFDNHMKRLLPAVRKISSFRLKNRKNTSCSL